MNKLPPYLKDVCQGYSVCLILEGDEEYYYFERLKELNWFSKIYTIKPVNAKSENKIPARFQEKYNSNSYDIVLIICDMDRKPTEYENIVKIIDSILGEGKAEKIITFTRPCTLQVILSHFGDVKLTTQAKKAARPDVERLTGVKGYDAHTEQLKEICSQIPYHSYECMKKRVAGIGDNPAEIPSSNILRLFEWLKSDNPSWIENLNDIISQTE